MCGHAPHAALPPPHHHHHCSEWSGQRCCLAEGRGPGQVGTWGQATGKDCMTLVQTRHWEVWHMLGITSCRPSERQPVRTARKHGVENRAYHGSGGMATQQQCRLASGLATAPASGQMGWAHLLKSWYNWPASVLSSCEAPSRVDHSPSKSSRGWLSLRMRSCSHTRQQQQQVGG